MAVPSSVVLWWAMTWQADASPAWDTATTVGSLIAQYLMIRKVLGSWWWWIAVDVAYVGIYSAQHLFLTAALQPLFIVMCVAGLRAWRRPADTHTLAAASASAPVRSPLPDDAVLGLVVGKFLPPHAGHALLVDTARAGSDHVVVVVCARPDDAVPARLRVGALRETHPGVTVVVTPDDIPDHDPAGRAHEISRAWAQRCAEVGVAAVGRRPDVVFTSEEYGPRWAGHLGARHVPVDPARVRVPVLGTAVRADPLREWEFLHRSVRVWYLPRVVVLGAESTGTTTLAQDLAAHYGCPWVPEYRRAYCEELLAAGQELAWRSEDFTHIAARQLADEDRVARQAADAGHRLMICDTDALATSVWHERYLGGPSPAVRRLAGSRRYTLYVLTGDDVPFVQDGTRDGEHLRGWMTGRFREALATRPEPWIEVTGGRAERLAVATARIDALLPGLTSAALPEGALR